MPSGQGGAKKGDEGRARGEVVKSKSRKARGYGERGPESRKMGPSEQEHRYNGYNGRYILNYT